MTNDNANSIEEFEEDEVIQEEVVQELSKSAKEIARRKDLLTEYQSTPEYVNAILKRLKINDACFKQPKARQLIYTALSVHESIDDIVNACTEFIELFAFTSDPRPQADPHDAPFILYPFQKDSIRWMIERIERGEDGLIEKSRDMGMTWTVAVWVPIFYWLFRDNINFLVGSYKENLVDDRTIDSIFGKIDYSIRSLPKWLLPRGWNAKKNRTQLKIVNPMNWNQITGDTMNPNFGRGARKTCIIFDELGFWDYSKDAWESASQSTTCRIALGTPKGMNYYGLLAHSDIAKLTLHWTKHPLHDNKWYEYECSRNSPEAIAQELDISYTKSQEGRVYPEWSEVNVTKGNFPYNPNVPLYVGWDFGASDDTAIIWCQKNPDNGKLRIIDTYAASGKVIKFYVPLITGFFTDTDYQYSTEELKIINEHKNWRKAIHFGDPAGRFRNSVTDTTVISVLKESNININFKDSWKEFGIRKTALRELINRGIELNLNKRTEYFDICILNSSYPSVKANGLDLIKSQKPKHDAYSHYRSSMEYLSLGLKEIVHSVRESHSKTLATSRSHMGRAISY